MVILYFVKAYYAKFFVAIEPLMVNNFVDSKHVRQLLFATLLMLTPFRYKHQKRRSPNHSTDHRSTNNESLGTFT